MTFGTEALSYAYGRSARTPALTDVAIAPCRGVLGVLGPNGAGKTTLLRLAATVLPLQGGTIRIGEVDVSARSGRERVRAARAACGYLPQHFPILPHYTAAEYLTYLGWLAGLSPARSRSAADRCLEAVNLADQRAKRTGDLSGGMRRRLGIAQTLLTRPSVVLLDEPTTGLDPVERRRFRDLLAGLATRTTVVLSTHLLEDVVRLADHVVVLAEGSVRFQGGLRDLAAGDDPSVDELEEAYERLVSDARAIA